MDAVKQKIKPTPVVVTPVQTPPAPVQVSGLPVMAPPPVRSLLGGNHLAGLLCCIMGQRPVSAAHPVLLIVPCTGS